MTILLSILFLKHLPSQKLEVSTIGWAADLGADSTTDSTIAFGIAQMAGKMAGSTIGLSFRPLPSQPHAGIDFDCCPQSLLPR